MHLYLGRQISRGISFLGGNFAAYITLELTTMVTRLCSATFLIASTMVAGPAAAQNASGIERAISAFEKQLPGGWSVAERTPNEYPWGHHFCDEYAGPKGTKLTLVGPKAVSVVWTSRSGEPRQTPIAKESLEVWFMPPEYRDSWIAWLCLSRPVQPVTVLKTSQVSVFGRPSHRLNSEDEFRREVLDKAQFVTWPESPHHDYSRLSWSTWTRDIESLLKKALPR